MYPIIEKYGPFGLWKRYLCPECKSELEEETGFRTCSGYIPSAYVWYAKCPNCNYRHFENLDSV